MNGTEVREVGEGTVKMEEKNGKDTEEEDESSEEPALEITISNVVCNFSVRCHLNLKHIAMNGHNVEFHKEMGMLIMKFRRPRCTASIWSSGKVTMTGATSAEDAKKGARRCARSLQKLGYTIKFTNFRIVNVLATCTMPFAIGIAEFSQAYPRLASYEPELHPGVHFKIKEIGATLKIFSTGSITITAPSIENVDNAVKEIHGLVYDYKKERRSEDIQLFPMSERKRKREEFRLKKQNGHQKRKSHKRARLDVYEKDFINDEDEDEGELIIDEEDEDVVAVSFTSPVDEEDESEEEG